MKYLKKYESLDGTDIQYEEVDSIFAEYIDDEDIGYIENKSQAYIKVSIYKTYVKVLASDIDKLDVIIDDYNNNILLMKKLKTQLSRLDYLKYKWAFESNSEEYIIKIYRQKEFTLYDIFLHEDRYATHAIITIEETIAKDLFKKLYNLNLTYWSYNEATSGYYGKKASITLGFNPQLSEYNSKDIINDLRNLKRHSESGHDKSLFYNVKLGYSYLTIEI